MSSTLAISEAPPLWRACETRDLPLLIEALQTSDKEERSPNEGYTPLMVCANHTAYDLVAHLLSVGANVNAQSDGGMTALMLAMNPDEPEAPRIVAQLLAGGADVNIVSGGANSALMEASHMGNLEILNMLLAAGATVNHTNQYGETALMTASMSRGKVAIVARLLQAGADPALQDVDGLTALTTAVKYKNQAVYEFLRDAISVKLT